jgi:hypothetical protein
METASLKKSLKVSLVQAIRGVALSSYADGALLTGASVLSEGAIVDGDGGERIYAGSTMVSIRLGGDGDPPLDAGPIRDGELLAAVRGSIGFRTRLLRLARAEAERRCAPFLVCEMRTEPVFRVEGDLLFVDIDVECPLAAPLSGEDGADRGAR